MNSLPLSSQTPDTLINDSIARIEFEPCAKQNYGFDAYTKGKQHIFYQHLPTQTGKTYHVAWKSIGAGKTDHVDVKLKYLFNGFARKNLHFETSDGEPVKYKIINSEAIYRLQIKGEQARSKQGKTYSISAYYKKDGQDYLVGKLNIKPYNQIKKNIAIVPVNGADIDIKGLEKYINSVFKQAVAKIKITEFPLTIPQDSLNITALTEFEAHQKRLELFRRHLEATGIDTAKADYVLFLFEKPANTALQSVTYNNQPYGIFYLEKGAKEKIYSKITQTAAHGCFKLRHSWEMGACSQNGTDNLMDYKGGTELYVYQWQNIHDPVGGVGWFQDAEQGKSMDLLLGLILDGYMNAALKFVDILRDMGATNPDADIKNESITISADLEIEGVTFRISKEFREGGNMVEYTHFLLNWGAEPGDAYEVNYAGLDFIKYWAKALDNSINDRPPMAIDILARTVTGFHTTLYGWFTGDDPFTEEDLAGWEHALGVLDVFPAEALGKMAIVAAFIKVGDDAVDLAEQAALFRKIVRSVGDAEKANKIFAHIGKLAQRNKFLEDMVSSSSKVPAEKSLANNLGNISERTIDGWEALKKANVDEAIRNNIDDLAHVEKYLINSGKSIDGVADEIIKAGGYQKWLGNIAKKTGVKAIDDFLATVPKIDNISASQLPEGYEIFTKNGSKYIRRVNKANINTPRLMVDGNGAIVAYTKTERLASSAKLRGNLEKLIGKAPDNHQAHHLVPDNVVKNSPIHQEALKRGLYDIDRASNGKFLAETGEDFAPISEAYPTHFGSHPNYDIEIRGIIDDVLDNHGVLPSQAKSLPNSKLSQIIDDIEDLSLGVLEDWTPSKLN